MIISDFVDHFLYVRSLSSKLPHVNKLERALGDLLKEAPVVSAERTRIDGSQVAGSARFSVSNFPPLAGGIPHVAQPCYASAPSGAA